MLWLFPLSDHQCSGSNIQCISQCMAHKGTIITSGRGGPKIKGGERNYIPSHGGGAGVKEISQPVIGGDNNQFVSSGQQQH